ncbi:MAG: ABC transporter permease [Proteobacteria bacterium]|nr:ABC transporter permease [Pseudomonadota bacterium]
MMLTNSIYAAPETGLRARVRERSGEFVEQARSSFRHNPLGALGLGIILAIVLVAVFAPQLATYDPDKLNREARLLPPSAENWFGTDASGRDVYSRVVYGSRISLQVAVVVMLIATTVGSLLGAVAGFFGGLVDEILMRITDVFLAFPALILAMAVNAALGPGIGSAMLAVGFTWWPVYARLVRSQVMSVRSHPYVEAAICIGATRRRVLFRHILPNCAGPIIVQMTLDAGYVVLTVAGLSFVGLGAQPPSHEWGFMVSQGANHILTQWWWSTFPGLAICVLVVGLNLVGDFLRDGLDPRLSRTVV